MIVYDRLWKTMQEKGISQYKLICRILECNVEDIIEYKKDKTLNL